jgi:predicted HAD superfamily phosphohydrolase
MEWFGLETKRTEEERNLRMEGRKEGHKNAGQTSKLIFQFSIVAQHSNYTIRRIRDV